MEKSNNVIQVFDFTILSKSLLFTDFIFQLSFLKPEHEYI